MPRTKLTAKNKKTPIGRMLRSSAFGQLVATAKSTRRHEAKTVG